jgi:hypothetical protein
MGALYVALGVAMGLSPRRGTLFLDLVLLALLGLTIAAPILLWRIRAFSASGYPGFLMALGVFSIWNGVTAGVSSATGWWGTDQPGSHVTVSFAVAALPLLLGAWLVGRRRRASPP